MSLLFGYCFGFLFGCDLVFVYFDELGLVVCFVGLDAFVAGLLKFGWLWYLLVDYLLLCCCFE